MKSIIKLIIPVLLLFVSGCISWDEGWKTKVQVTGQSGYSLKIYFMKEG